MTIIIERAETKERSAAPEKFKPTAWVIFDLDGVLIRWPQYHLPKEQEQADFFAGLQQLHSNDVALSVLTNRPPAAMQILAYQLGVNNGLWITESGGSVYSVSDHKAWVLPEWVLSAKKDVPESRLYLEDNLGIAGRTLLPVSNNVAQFEPGMGLVKTVIVPPNGLSSQEYYEKIFAPVWSDYQNSSLFNIEVGKAIDINPVGLSKSEGIKNLLTFNQIDPQNTPTIFIADNTRDIPAGKVLLENGGFVGAVGNASPDFKQTIADHPRGIIAPAHTSYYGSVINIFNEFFK